MSDIVISGRIPIKLMDQLRKLSKSNTELINEGLSLLIQKYNKQSQCIQDVYKKTIDSEYQDKHQQVISFLEGLK